MRDTQTDASRAPSAVHGRALEPGPRRGRLGAGGGASALGVHRARTEPRANPAARLAAVEKTVEKLVQDRHDLAAPGVVESAVRAAGSIPTQGGGTRVLPHATHALATSEAPV